MSLLTILGCGSKPVTYLVLDGYVGPVVVVFGDPSGKAAIRGKDGGEIYQIPSDGVLRLSTPAPPGTHEIRFFYLGTDGQRRKIPYDVDEDTLQAFDHVAGATGKDEAGTVTNWHAFVVGVPSERNDWVEVRERATFHAIGVSGYPSSQERRWSEEER